MITFKLALSAFCLFALALVTEAAPAEKEPDIQIFGRTNNNYHGGSMVKIRQRYFTVESQNHLDEGVKLTPVDAMEIIFLNGDMIYKGGHYKEIVSIETDVEGVMPGMYLTDLSESGGTIEMIAVKYDFDDNKIVGIKLTGDEYVPATEPNFRIDQDTLNGYLNFATLGYKQHVDADARLETTGATSFKIFSLEKWVNDRNGLPDNVLEYYMVNLMDEYKKAITLEVGRRWKEIAADRKRADEINMKK